MRDIKGLVLVLLACSDGIAGAAEALPSEVDAFVRDRGLCDHFRDEPHEGDLPEQVERASCRPEVALSHNAEVMHGAEPLRDLHRGKRVRA